jgi:hypothetical protein
VCRYRCDWDDEVRPDVSEYQPEEVFRLLGSEIAGRLAVVSQQFTPETIDELFEHETAYDFARALDLPHYEWFSYRGVAGCRARGENDYVGCIEIPGQSAS